MTTTYTIRNTSAKAKTLIIEHPLHSESKIIGAQPVETTEAKRRFEAALKPASTETLKVVEETLDSATVAVSDLSPDKLLLYRQGQAVSAAARKALEEIAAKKKALAGVAGEIERARAQFAAIERDQQRLRENLRALGAVPGQQEQVQRYSQQLGVFETQLAALRDRQAALESQSATLDRELKDLLEKLSF
jgi:flagellar biosynthesis chaperone FliJ